MENLLRRTRTLMPEEVRDRYPHFRNLKVDLDYTHQLIGLYLIAPNEKGSDSHPRCVCTLHYPRGYNSSILAKQARELIRNENGELTNLLSNPEIVKHSTEIGRSLQADLS